MKRLGRQETGGKQALREDQSKQPSRQQRTAQKFFMSFKDYMKKKRQMEADLTADEEQSRRTQLKDQFVKANFDDAVTDVHSKKSSTSTHETAASRDKNDKKDSLRLQQL